VHGGRQIDRVVVVDLDCDRRDRGEHALHRGSLGGRQLGRGVVDGGAFADGGREVRHHAHTRAMAGVALDVVEANARGDRDKHRRRGDRAAQTLRRRLEVLRLDGYQHDVRADAGALRVVGDAHAVLAKRGAAGRRDLGDGDVVGGSHFRAQQAAQERLAHKAAADDADAH
jgi:hypothetical protein